MIARGFTVPYAGYPTNRTLAQSLRPFPQFTGNIQPHVGAARQQLVRFAPDEADQALLARARPDSAAFTWQKTLALGNGATVFGGSNNGAQGGGINDMFNRANQKSLAGDYRPLSLVVAFNVPHPARDDEQGGPLHHGRLDHRGHPDLSQRLAHRRAGLGQLQYERVHVPEHALQPQQQP